MSLDFSTVKPQYEQLKALISQIPGTAEAMVTNKRLVTCCADRFTALSLIRELRGLGFNSDVERGLKTSRFYVATSFNYPF